MMTVVIVKWAWTRRCEDLEGRGCRCGRGREEGVGGVSGVGGGAAGGGECRGARHAAEPRVGVRQALRLRGRHGCQGDRLLGQRA